MGFSIINKYRYQFTSVITCQFILVNNIFLGSKIDIRIQSWMLAKAIVILEVKSWMKRKNTVDSKFCQPNSVLCKLDAGGKFIISFLAIFCNLSNVSFVNHFLSRFRQMEPSLFCNTNPYKPEHICCSNKPHASGSCCSLQLMISDETNWP